MTTRVQYFGIAYLADAKKCAQAQEIESYSNAIMEARWAALRKKMDPGVKVCSPISL